MAFQRGSSYAPRPVPTWSCMQAPVPHPSETMAPLGRQPLWPGRVDQTPVMVAVFHLLNRRLATYVELGTIDLDYTDLSMARLTLQKVLKSRFNARSPYFPHAVAEVGLHPRSDTSKLSRACCSFSTWPTASQALLAMLRLVADVGCRIHLSIDQVNLHMAETTNHSP